MLLFIIVTLYVAIGAILASRLTIKTIRKPENHMSTTHSLRQIPWYEWVSVWTLHLLAWPYWLYVDRKVKRGGYGTP